jgi:predicted RNA-binding Zn ribbon-like protein
VIETSKDHRRLGFPFRSGRLCLDFVATVAKRDIAEQELLATPDDLATWFHVASLPPTNRRISHEGLAAARELREAVHKLARARVDGDKPPRTAIRVVNAAAQPGTPGATLGLDAHTAIPASSALLESLLAVIARDAVDLFSGPYVHRIRACLGRDCSLFFVDRSRPGSRRWCAMAACGEKASSATYRRRHPANATRS